MRAIQIRQHGSPDVMSIVDLPMPSPEPGQVRVRHEAIGVNYLDTYHRTGLYPTPLPLVLGTEGAGVVDAVGANVTNVRVGDRVAYVAGTPGSYAEARLLEADRVVAVPPAIELATAAAVLLKGMTVQYLLRRTRTGLEPGDAIVWHAAAGGVGLIACQWARALGYVVIGTAGSPEKCELARAAGAHHVIDYHREDVVGRVRELTAGHGVKVVYDGVGKDTFERSLDCLAPLGLLVSFGNASGPVPPVSLGMLMQKGSLYVQRPTLGTYTRSRQELEQTAGELFAMLESGGLRVDDPRRYALVDAAQAHRDLEARATTGSSVLVP